MCCTSALRAAPAFNSKKGTKLKVFSRVCLADSRALQNFHCSVKPYRHTATGLLESPPVTSGGDLVSGLELKHKLCLGEPTPSCRLDHCSRARSSEGPAVHAVHLLQSQILHSGWKHLPQWAGAGPHPGHRVRLWHKAKLSILPAWICWEAPQPCP